MDKKTMKHFDLEAAFKALDEIQTPVAQKGIKANRVNLHERFSCKQITDTLLEDYYDVSDNTELEVAKEEREGEVAKAKLARIEKIVDLDAETEEDILPSYVGKIIVQCPQCMTLFYKNAEDLETSDENPMLVNIGEACQHCGNVDGYNVIGKVDAVEEGEEETTGLEAPETAEPAAEESAAETAEETTEEPAAEETSMEEVNLESPAETVDETEETKVAEESLKRNSKLTSADVSKIINNPTKLKIDRQQELVEGLDDLDTALEEHNDYVDYLKKAIDAEEQAIARETNEEIKSAIQRRIDLLNSDLEAALPASIKDKVLNEPVEDVTVEETETETTEESLKKNPKISSAEVSKIVSDPTKLKIDKQQNLVEGVLDAAADDALDSLFDTPEFRKPISDEEVEEYIDDSYIGEDLEEGEPLDEGRFSDFLHKAKTKVKQVFSGEKKTIDSIFKDNGGYEIVFLKPDTKAAEDLASKMTAYRDAIKEKRDATKQAEELVQACIGKDENGQPRKDGIRITGAAATIKEADEKGERSALDENGAVIVKTKGKDEKLGGPLVVSIWEKGSKSSDYADLLKDALVAEKEDNERQDKIANKLNDTEASLPTGWEKWTNYGDSADKPFIYKIGKDTTARKCNSNVIGTAFEEATELSNNINDAITIYGDLPEGEQFAVATFKGGKRTSQPGLIRQYLVKIKGQDVELESLNEFEEIDETTLEEHITNYLTNVYSNVAGFKLTECCLNNTGLTVRGTINYNSGKSSRTSFRLNNLKESAFDNTALTMAGQNQKLAEGYAFGFNFVKSGNKLLTESITYNYTIKDTKVSGNTCK